MKLNFFSFWSVVIFKNSIFLLSTFNIYPSIQGNQGNTHRRQQKLILHEVYPHIICRAWHLYLEIVDRHCLAPLWNTYINRIVRCRFRYQAQNILLFLILKNVADLVATFLHIVLVLGTNSHIFLSWYLVLVFLFQFFDHIFIIKKFC